jgi:hypothetical protein
MSLLQKEMIFKMMKYVRSYKLIIKGKPHIKSKPQEFQLASLLEIPCCLCKLCLIHTPCTSCPAVNIK